MHRSISKEAWLRIAADAVLVNVALLGAFLVRFLNLIQKSRYGSSELRQTLAEYLTLYLPNAALITALSLCVFAASGFYTYGRAYRSRFKALVVLQSVSLVYVIYGALAYGLQWSDSVLTTSLWGCAWLFTAVILMAARLWSVTWLALHKTRPAKVQPDRPVERVLLLGGGGYIGSALIPKLLEKGFKVRLLDRMLYGKGAIQPYLESGQVELLQADFRQVDKVVQAMQEVDAVVHLGALVGDPACALDEELTIEINLMATRMIAEVAKGSQVGRFVFASTCSVYGASDEILDERSQLHPVSLYARSKIASEKVLRDMASDTFCPTCLRFGTIYGFSGRTRFDLVVNLLTAKACIDKKITLYGGDQWRPFLHVEDAAQAVLRALEAPLPAVRDQIFNVGSNEQNYTLEQVGQLIKEQVPEAELLELGNDSDRRNYRVNFDKIKDALNFNPEWTVERGIGQVVDAIRSGRVTDYTSSEYSNVKSLNEEGAAKLVLGELTWAHQAIEEAAPPEQNGNGSGNGKGTVPTPAKVGTN